MATNLKPVAKKSGKRLVAKVKTKRPPPPPLGNKRALGASGNIDSHEHHTVYESSFPETAFKLCLLMNATDVQLGEFFGVTEKCINDWKKRYPEFKLALTRGKTLADAEVANGLYRRAVGMRVQKTHVGLSFGQSVVTPYEEEIPPDVAAATRWLHNRASAWWKPDSAAQSPMNPQDAAAAIRDAVAQMNATIGAKE